MGIMPSFFVQPPNDSPLTQDYCRKLKRDHWTNKSFLWLFLGVLVISHSIATPQS